MSSVQPLVFANRISRSFRVVPGVVKTLVSIFVAHDAEGKRAFPTTPAAPILSSDNTLPQYATGVFGVLLVVWLERQLPVSMTAGASSGDQNSAVYDSRSVWSEK